MYEMHTLMAKVNPLKSFSLGTDYYLPYTIRVVFDTWHDWHLFILIVNRAITLYSKWIALN